MRTSERAAIAVGLMAAVLGIASCAPVLPPPDADRPQGETDLAVTASADPAVVFEGFGVTLSASATGGTSPYLYRWDQNDGPAEVALTDVTDSTLDVAELTVQGRYVFRVTATDSEGFRATGYADVQVTEAVTASAPRLLVVGEPGELSATTAADDLSVSYLWEVVQGDAAIAEPTSPETTLTTAAGETVKVTLTLTMSSNGGAPVESTQEFDVVSVYDLQPTVLIETNYGPITFGLNGEVAPLHTANFLQYVDEAFYDGLLFHRNACEQDPETEECHPFVLQGGGYERIDGELELREPTHDPVSSEADNGLTHGEVYSVGLALRGGDVDSGTTQIFINMKDNSFLDDQGFTVFGTIVDGIDVVDTIVEQETTDSSIIPGESSEPVEDVVMERVTRTNP